VIRSSLLVACSFAATTLAGCSLDDRTLRAELGSNGGSGAGGSSDSGGAGRSPGNGGSGAAEAGAAGESPADLPGNDGAAGTPDAPAQVPISTSGGCADLDEDKTPDCMQSLVGNPDFDSNVDQWTAEAGASLTWDSGDALGKAGSGSALLSTASGMAAGSGSGAVAASQCLSVTSGNIVAAYANAFVEADQSPSGVASVEVYFFDAAGCAGTATIYFSTPQPLDAAAGTWLTLKSGLTAPKGTHSVQVRLAIAKQPQAASFRARFDNILVKQIAPK
jgi:hypothetical protein